MRALLQRWRTYQQNHRWARWGFELGLLLLALLAISAWQTRHPLPSGERAPGFTLTDLSGQSWSLESLKGKPVILHFWAPWCGICKAETGTYSSLRKSLGDEVHVLSVAVAWKNLSEVRGFVEKEGVDYPVLLGDGAMMRAYRVDVFPTTYFLSEDGTIRHQAVGFTTGFGFRWRRWLYL